MKLERIKRSAILWISIIFMFSCAPTPQNRHQLEAGAPTSRPTVTLISSITPFVPSPLPTKTPTQTPIPTNTSIPSPTLRTPIRVQNLDLEEAKQKMDFLSGSSNCDLPCFNGLTPGISSVWDIQGFFARLGFDSEKDRIVDDNGYLVSKDDQEFWILEPIQGVVYSQVPYLLTSNFHYRPFLSVEWNEVIVTTIELGYLPYRSWISIPRFYEQLGKPDTIKIVGDGGEGNIVAFYLQLYFSAYKTSVEYVIRSTDFTDVCLYSDAPADARVTIGQPSYQYFDLELTNWHEMNGMDFDNLVNKVGTGDFCLPYAVEK